MKADDAPMKRNVLAADTNVAAPHAPVFDQSAGNKLGGVNGDGKADALRRQDDGGVDADDGSSRSDEWPARIAGIESGIGLNEVVDQAAGTRAQRAAERADHPRGD